MRYTKADLDAAFGRYNRSIEHLLRVDGELALIKGSKAHGKSFKAVIIDPEGAGHRDAPGTSDGFLGWTGREATETLRHLARAFEYAKAIEENHKAL